ncbi:hypothetical protein [Cellulomonas hominis]|uniref:hypothetical protein n=1 Tax=Cellulomonas hominis TaxID=156981 RepID=UPI001B970F0C|nr:hypothetical protein [Cellulomonas hominis]VTR76042.1 hypothetical protein CHMI_00798 [Cellulomonas hominis]
MEEKGATASGRRDVHLQERVAAGWSTLRAAVAGWLNEQSTLGVSRRAVLRAHARTVVTAIVGAAATIALWLLIGPSIVVANRRITEQMIASEPAVQNAWIVVVVAVLLIARWVVWAVRRRPVSASGTAIAGTFLPVAVDEGVARHEAAHAVVASILGFKVLQLNALPTGLAAGTCEWQFRNDGESAVENAWVSMCALAAGEVECPDGAVAWPGASGDTHQSLATATFIIRRGQPPAGYDGPLTLDGLLAAAHRTAAELLAQNRAAVDAVTAALTARGRLDESAIAVAIAGAGTVIAK